MEVNTEAHATRGNQSSHAKLEPYRNSRRRPSAATDFCIDIACAGKFPKIFHCKVRAIWSGLPPIWWSFWNNHINFNEMYCITVQTPLEILWNASFCLIWGGSASNCSNFAMKNFQKLFRTCYIDAKMSYESIARIERVSKSTQTEIFRFEKNPLQKKNPSNKSTGAPITPRAANHVRHDQVILRIKLGGPENTDLNIMKIFWTASRLPEDVCFIIV